MWSHHFYWGFNIGFEIYEGEVDGAPVDYFLVNIGPLRIQKAEWAQWIRIEARTQQEMLNRFA